MQISNLLFEISNLFFLKLQELSPIKVYNKNDDTRENIRFPCNDLEKAVFKESSCKDIYTGIL